MLLQGQGITLLDDLARILAVIRLQDQLVRIHRHVPIRHVEVIVLQDEAQRLLVTTQLLGDHLLLTTDRTTGHRLHREEVLGYQDHLALVDLVCLGHQVLAEAVLACPDHQVLVEAQDHQEVAEDVTTNH